MANEINFLAGIVMKTDKKKATEEKFNNNNIPL